LNPWGDEPPPLVRCESRATAGVLERVVSPYCCPIAGTAGPCGGFLRTEVAPLLTEDRRRLLYLGDLDRSGSAAPRPPQSAWLPLMDSEASLATEQSIHGSPDASASPTRTLYRLIDEGKAGLSARPAPLQRH